jgi:taurine dioxygenase
MKIEKNNAPLGAVVRDIDLSKKLTGEEVRTIEQALAEHGVLCFPDQELSDADHVAFTSQLGPLEVNVASSGMTGDTPEVMVLSNIVRDGKPIGLADAGQGWHTDMSYSQIPGHATALHALEIPYENGKPLGNTEFANMYMACETLPADVRKTIQNRFAIRDFAKFWNYMIEQKGSTRPPLTTEQRRKKPPVLHPMIIRHPISGRETLYADPAYTVSIVGLPRDESDSILQFIFEHQIKEEFVYRHQWAKHDFLIWDNLASIHQATGGYRSDQPRLMHRTQVAFDVARYASLAYTDNNAINF